MNFQNFEVDHKEHNNLKKKLNKDRYDAIEQYKSMICPSCVHYKNIDHQDCSIVRRIDGKADCINYKCNEYCKKRVEK